jgi:hypothetical protein
VPVKPTQLAYAAGIIDGEGCIRVNRTRNGVPVIRVHVTNTDARLTRTLHEWFGGYVWMEAKAYMPNAKIRYVWEVSARKAAAFLGLVRPYLVLKQEQADLALAIQATKVARNKIPAGITAERDQLAARLRVLTKRGAA